MDLYGLRKFKNVPIAYKDRNSISINVKREEKSCCGRNCVLVV